MHTRTMELQRLGRFRLIRPLDVSSATVRVLLAVEEDAAGNEVPGSRALVKLLNPNQPGQEQLEAQFQHEARLLGAFNHPGIPALLAEGNQDGLAYMVLEYVDGVNLAELLGHDTSESGGLSKEIAVYLMGQLADALHHAHGAFTIDENDQDVPLEVIHRDICPRNILLSREGDVKLADFSAARSIWLSPEQDAKQAGTKAYMAPERVAGTAEASVKTDLFSLAVTLWEILKGQRCFPGASEIEVMDQIVKFDISHSTRRVQGLSPKLSEIVRKNLDRDPGRRYASAFQVLQRLAQAPEAGAAEESRAALAAMVADAAQARGR